MYHNNKVMQPYFLNDNFFREYCVLSGTASKSENKWKP